MEDRGTGGLAGRPRKAHKRRRADRLQSQQLIDEYLDTEVEGPSIRPIPIRGRSDFLPTVVAIGSAGENVQLELPLRDSSQGPTVWDAGRNSEGLLYADVEPKTERRTCKSTECSRQPNRVAHFEMFEFSSRKKSDSFSMKRFLYGCLLGSSAAAMILLILQIVL